MAENNKISEASVKSIKESIENRGILFEDEIADGLNNIFSPNIWNISQNFCLRETPIHEGFNERYEIDFFISRINPFELNFLIEAKFSSYEWCFFQYKRLQVEENNKTYNLVFKDGLDGPYFSPTMNWNNDESFLVEKVKRSIPLRFNGDEVVLNKKGTIETTERDLVRDSVRQLAKNTQVYLKRMENEEVKEAIIFLIIVTNTPLKFFDYNDIGFYQDMNYACFEFDDFMFWKREKLATSIDGRLKALSKFHVLIVNFNHLEHFVRQMLPECILT